MEDGDGGSGSSESSWVHKLTEHLGEGGSQEGGSWALVIWKNVQLMQFSLYIPRLDTLFRADQESSFLSDTT